MAPCEKKCSLCPFNVEGPDRFLRAIWYANAATGFLPPCWERCLAKLRDVSELLNCLPDFEDAINEGVLHSDCNRLYAKRLDQGARVLGLLSSCITPIAVFYDWEWVDMGRFGEWSEFGSLAVSAAGNVCAAGSCVADRPNKSTNEAIDALSEATYMTLGIVEKRIPPRAGMAIGFSTAVWGIYKYARAPLTPPE